MRGINEMDGEGFYIFGRIPILFGLLSYLRKTSHIESFGSGPIQRCDLIREPPQSGPSDERGFDLREDDRMLVSNEPRK